MTGSKAQGGLGFRSLYGFNIALLGKQCWNMLNNPGSLVSRLFKARYFSNTSMFEAQKGRNSSYIWQGLKTAMDSLRSGFRWVVGNGESICATKDQWIRGKKDYCVVNDHSYAGRSEKVSTYIDAGTKSWKTHQVFENFLLKDARAIISIPLPRTDTEDRVVWAGSSSGIYTAKEGYKYWLNLSNIVHNGMALNTDHIEDAPIWLLNTLSTGISESNIKPPSNGVLKLNVDASFRSDKENFSLDMVIRDSNGDFVEGRTMCKPPVSSVFEAEAVGVKEALSWVKSKGLTDQVVEVETDSMLVVLGLRSTSRNLLEVGKVIEQCRMLHRELPDGYLTELTKVYSLDAVFDNLEDVPEDIIANKRYAGSSKRTVQEVAESVKKDFGSIDILVHSLANGPEVTKPLLETSRKGYLAAISASSYSYISLLKNFIPIMNPGMNSIM
ncbi:hypothetical protein AgCh_034234 [Apium graveolens]